jgi:hypothetical protein
VDPKVFTVYIQRVRPTFSGFSYNRAVLLDLTKNGPLPVVDAVTKGGLISAIHELKARNARLKDLIREKCNELGVEAPSF